MDEVIVGDLGLANIIERVSAEDDAAYVRAMKQVRPDQGYENFVFKGGVACFVGRSPYSGVHGFGMIPADHNETLLDDIENYFKEKGYPAVISVASVIEPRTIKILYDRGYGTVAYRNVYIQNSRPELRTSNSISLREVESADDLKLWLTIVSNGFAGKKLDAPDDISIGQSTKVGNQFFIGYYEGEPAAASALYMNGNVARLGGMGTLVEYRGKGLQNLMI